VLKWMSVDVMFSTTGRPLHAVIGPICDTEALCGIMPKEKRAAWQVWAAYSPVKNSPADARAKVAGGTPSHSATTGELDIYAANCRCAPPLT